MAKHRFGHRRSAVWPIWLVAALLAASLAFYFVARDALPGSVFISVLLAIILGVLFWKRRA